MSGGGCLWGGLLLYPGSHLFEFAETQVGHSSISLILRDSKLWAELNCTFSKCFYLITKPFILLLELADLYERVGILSPFDKRWFCLGEQLTVFFEAIVPLSPEGSLPFRVLQPLQ